MLDELEKKRERWVEKAKEKERERTKRKRESEGEREEGQMTSRKSNWSDFLA